MRALLFVSLFAFVSCGRNSDRNELSQSGEQSNHVYVRIPRTLATNEFMSASKFEVDHMKSQNYLFGYIQKKNLEKISNQQRSEMIVIDENSWKHEAHDLMTLLPIEDKVLSAKRFEDYHNFPALTHELQDLAAQFPEHAALSSIGKSVKGRDLWMMKISEHADVEENKPRVLLIANMHGDETVGRELMIYLIRKLLKEYESSERIKAIVNHAQVYIIPSMNPDGFELSKRKNADDVDLNRNFPDFISDPTNTPEGRAVETAAIMELHKKYHFDASLNFHGGEVCFNLPWDTKANRNEADKFGDDLAISTMGRAYAEANPTMVQNTGGSFTRGVTYGYEWYEVDGGMQDWSIYYHDSMHATVELSTTKYPAAAKLPTYWKENEESFVKFIENSMTGIYLSAKDSSGSPLPQIKIASSASKRVMSFNNGFVSRALPAVSQQITVSADGFRPQAFTVTPQMFKGQVQAVTLESL